MRTRWDLMPRRVKRPGMLAGGDGSTLSLDFTAMSSLDSRFTFSRSSPATFINSSGLVKYAAHELYLNTQFTGLDSTPSLGWAYAFNTGGGSILFEESTGEVTVDAISGRRGISRTSSVAGTSGRKMIASVDVTVTAGSLTPFDLIQEGSATNKQWYIDSTLYTSGTVPLDTPVTISLVFDSAANTNVYFGIGMNNTASGTATFKNPRMQFYSGTLPAPVVENTSTSASKLDTPRFDYDPTTLAPRGLLIEGSATNLLNWSESFATSGGTNNNWADTNITRNSTNNTDPANGTNALRITASAGNGTIISTSAMGTSAERTFSIWLRRVSGTGNIQYTLNNGSTYTTQAITSSWVRYTFAATTAAQQVGIRIVTSGDAIELWGAQLEAGSGASSYIPTGSSTVQRAADSCSMTGTNFSSWYPAGTTSGTFFCQFDNSRSNLGFAINPTPIALGEYGAGNLIAGLMNTTVVGSGATILVWGSGGSGLQQSPIGATISQGNKIAFAFNGQTATGSLNGGSGTATTTGTVNAKTILFIGGSGSGTSLVRDFIVAPIQRIKFFPSVFSTAQLQSLTQ